MVIKGKHTVVNDASHIEGVSTLRGRGGNRSPNLSGERGWGGGKIERNKQRSSASIAPPTCSTESKSPDAAEEMRSSMHTSFAIPKSPVREMGMARVGREKAMSTHCG